MSFDIWRNFFDFCKRIRQNEAFMDDHLSVKELSFLVFTFLGLVFEVFLLRDKDYIDDKSLFISHLLFVPALINVLLKIQLRLKVTSTRKMRSYSSSIYYQHRAIMSLFNVIMDAFNLSFFGGIRTIVVIIVAVINHRCVENHHNKISEFLKTIGI